METLNKKTYVVLKNYGVRVSTWTNPNDMLAFVLGGARNNMSKTLNQQVIKAALSNVSEYRKIIGKIYIEIYATENDSALEKLTQFLDEKKEKEREKKEIQKVSEKRTKKNTPNKE